MAGFLESLMGGYQFGSQIKQDRQQSKLAQLASQAYGAPREQRGGFIQQALGVDPSAGLALDKGLQGVDDQRTKTLVSAAKYLTAAPESARPGIYQQMKPSLAQFGMELPDQYDETVAKTAQALVDAYSPQTQSPAGFEEFRRTASAAGLSPGDDEYQRAARLALYLDRRPSNAALQYKEVTGSDGRKRYVAFDPNEVGAEAIGSGASYGAPVGGGAQTPSGVPGSQGNPLPQGGVDPVIEQIMASANELIAKGVPVDQVDGWVQSQMQPNGSEPAGQAPQQAPAQRSQASAPPPGSAQGVSLPPRLDYQNGGTVNPFESRAPEEQAALTKDAELRTQLGYMPQQQAIETRGAIDRTLGTERAKDQVAREIGEPARQEKVRLVLSGIDNVIETIDQSIGNVDWATAGALGKLSDAVPNTPAYELAKAVGTVKASIGFDRLQQMRDASPTGGALGQVAVQELDALQSSIASLDQGQSPATVRANMLKVRKHYQAWRDSVTQADTSARARLSGGAQAQAAPRATNPQTGEVLELRNGQWVPAQ